jgi:alkylation response protein AidB-like acyl-CoA dehydrogenase
MQSTRFAGEIADDAVNIFGGRGLTKTGYVMYSCSNLARLLQRA